MIQRVLATGVFLLAVAGAAAAEDQTTSLPPVTVLAPPPAVAQPPAAEGTGARAGRAGRCTGAESGSTPSFDCLNQKFKQQVDQINSNQTVPTAPLDARSPDIKIGVVNTPAVAQQYGKNFGVSVVPYRPPPPIYNSALGRR